MSVGAVTVRLRQETGRGILIRWAGTPAVRSKGEAQYERFLLIPELDQAVREAAGNKAPVIGC